MNSDTFFLSDSFVTSFWTFSPNFSSEALSKFSPPAKNVGVKTTWTVLPQLWLFLSEHNTFRFSARFLNQMNVAFTKKFMFVFRWKTMLVKWCHHRICLIWMENSQRVSDFVCCDGKRFYCRHQFLFPHEWNIHCQSKFRHRFAPLQGKMFAQPSHHVSRSEWKYNQFFGHGQLKTKTKLLFCNLQIRKLFEILNHTHSAKQKKQNQSLCLFRSLPNLNKSL